LRVSVVIRMLTASIVGSWVCFVAPSLPAMLTHFPEGFLKIYRWWADVGTALAAFCVSADQEHKSAPTDLLISFRVR